MSAKNKTANILDIAANMSKTRPGRICSRRPFVVAMNKPPIAHGVNQMAVVRANLPRILSMLFTVVRTCKCFAVNVLFNVLKIGVVEVNGKDAPCKTETRQHPLHILDMENVTRYERTARHPALNVHSSGDENETKQQGDKNPWRCPAARGMRAVSNGIHDEKTVWHFRSLIQGNLDV